MGRRIVTICGTGLGSSFFVEMNIQKILAKHGREREYDLSHSALFDVNWMEVDIAVVARDIADCVPLAVKKIVLDSIIDTEELEQKLMRIVEGD